MFNNFIPFTIPFQLSLTRAQTLHFVKECNILYHTYFLPKSHLTKFAFTPYSKAYYDKMYKNGIAGNLITTPYRENSIVYMNEKGNSINPPPWNQLNESIYDNIGILTMKEIDKLVFEDLLNWCLKIFKPSRILMQQFINFFYGRDSSVILNAFIQLFCWKKSY